MFVINKKFLLNCLLINVLLVTCISAGIVRREIINKNNSPSHTNGTDEVTTHKSLELPTARSTDAKLDTENQKISENNVDRKVEVTGNGDRVDVSKLSTEDNVRDLDNVEIIEDAEILGGGGGVADETNHESAAVKSKSTGEDEQVVTEREGESTTEYHFDISKYMTNSSGSLLNSESNENDEFTETSTPIDDMEKRFEEMELTTPDTTEFDKKHEEYRLSSLSQDDDDDGKPTTTESIVIKSETTTSINLSDIKENSTETKTTSRFTNLMIVDHENYNQEVNEMNATSPRPTKAKKGKYLENPEAATTQTDDEVSSWAASAVKNVEKMSSVSGQHYNLTTADLGAINDPTIMKSVSDWATIMETVDFSSDSTSLGDASTTIETGTEIDSQVSDAQEDANVIVSVTVRPPSRRPTRPKLRNKTDRPLDDIDFEQEGGSTTASYDRNTLPVDENANPKKIYSTSERPAVAETTTMMDDDDSDDFPFSTDNSFSSSIHDDDDTSVTERLRVRPTTDNNSVSSEKRDRTTESVRIEVIPDQSSSPSFNEETGIPSKVDPTFDTNSIERTTEKLNASRVDHSTIANRGNLKYSTVDANDDILLETVSPKDTDGNIEVITTSVPSAEEDGTPIEQTEVDETLGEQNSVESGEPPKDGDGGTDAKTILAITMSTLGVLALIGLVGLLFVMRKRQKNLTYGQRCRPVGLDAYSLDNVSVYNSVRRKNNMRMSKRSYGNSAFEDPALKNNVLSIPNLATFIQNQNSIFEEFKDIPMITARVEEVPQGCESKNRYANVVPLPETRVNLKRINDDEKTEYINANYVKGPKDAAQYYIATQGPLESTIPDFWRMIWEQNSKVIIMATDLNEGGVEKCAEYLPSSMVLDNQRSYDDYQVTLKNREVKEKYAVSTIHLKNMQTNTWREITHFWYQWPETSVPEDEASIIAMLLEARSYLKMSAPEQSDETGNDIKEENSENTHKNGSIDKSKSLQRNQGPLTVHCSPGTGRTGTVIACDIAIRALELPTRSVDIPQIVYYVRRGRASSVRTREQYEFIYKIANMYATKLTGPSTEN